MTSLLDIPVSQQPATSSPAPLRVTVIQPAMAKYRTAVFRELARRPGINLRVVYGAVQGLPNVETAGFDAVPLPLHEARVGPTLLSFHGAEWTYCTRRHSDVVVLRWSPRSVTLLPALLRARASGVPAVLWGHGYSKRPSGQRRSVRRWIGKLATAIVFYEPRTRDAYIREGCPPEKLFVALNSLDHSEIESARQWWLEHPAELAQFRQEQAVADGPVVLFVSRLQRANRVDLLVEATAELSRDLPTVKTVIIGNGGAEKAELVALARRLGVADNIIFLDGIYDELKLSPWFLSARVYCYPANIGLSLIHAFWNGLPVVTSDNMDSQNPEIVALDPGVNGVVYPHGSSEALADALRTIITNEDLQASMSSAARRTVEDNFTIPRMVDGLEAAIRYAGAKIATR